MKSLSPGGIPTDGVKRMNPAQPSSLEMFLPFGFILVIFYFMIIRPQGKRMKEQERLITELKRGDSVITQSGILGTIDGMTDMYVTLEIAPNVKIKMLKKQIAGTQASLEKPTKK
jgi:preprotein translocase subunit YajC